MEMLDKTQLQWLLGIVGVVAIILIYLWGMRVHIKEGIRRRRLQLSQLKEPVFGDTQALEPTEKPSNGYNIGGKVITPDHHLASEVLVDVEITRIERDKKPAFDDQKELAPDDNPSALHDVFNDALQDVLNDALNNQASTPRDEESVVAESTVENDPFAEADTRPKAEPVVAVEPPRDLSPKPVMSGPPQMTLALTVVAVPIGQSSFRGVDIEAAALDQNLEFSASGLLERYLPNDDPENADREPIFSMAHLRKPGLFRPEELEELTTPGLLLFMNLPGPMEEMKALDLLLVTADQLALKLGGMICDERRKRLTNHGLMHMRNEVIEFRRNQRAWAHSS